jgi:hypothetical protein
MMRSLHFDQTLWRDCILMISSENFRYRVMVTKDAFAGSPSRLSKRLRCIFGEATKDDIAGIVNPAVVLEDVKLYATRGALLM